MKRANVQLASVNLG